MESQAAEQCIHTEASRRHTEINLGFQRSRDSQRRPPKMLLARHTLRAKGAASVNDTKRKVSAGFSPDGSGTDETLREHYCAARVGRRAQSQCARSHVRQGEPPAGLQYIGSQIGSKAEIAAQPGSGYLKSNFLLECLVRSRGLEPPRDCSR